MGCGCGYELGRCYRGSEQRGRRQAESRGLLNWAWRLTPAHTQQPPPPACCVSPRSRSACSLLGHCARPLPGSLGGPGPGPCFLCFPFPAVPALAAACPAAAAASPAPVPALGTAPAPGSDSAAGLPGFWPTQQASTSKPSAWLVARHSGHSASWKQIRSPQLNCYRWY
jgi:hypothetical protein